jgi:ribonuclease BN (tRNA processing enzyme)
MSKANVLSAKVWGCRGSIAISGPESVKYGGNTTCFEIMSRCLPEGMKLFVDAGTGFTPAGNSYVKEAGNGLNFVTLFSHYHYDHTLGLTLSPPTFIPNVPMVFYGPKDMGEGPKDVITSILRRPGFPVDAKSVMGKMTFKTLEGFDVTVLVVHPKGGMQSYSLETFQRIEAGRRQIAIQRRKYELGECLVIRMQRANHGNATCISYRFEERPTGKVLVICTDHEDPAGVPNALRAHFRHADVLIIDAQYDDARYQTQTAGFGHGTPRGIMRQALMAGVRRVGITHHDPTLGTDAYLEESILKAALGHLWELQGDAEFRQRFGIADETTICDKDVFLCADYMTIQA